MLFLLLVNVGLGASTQAAPQVVIPHINRWIAAQIASAQDITPRDTQAWADAQAVSAEEWINQVRS